MSSMVFKSGRTVDSAAWDLALTLASRDQSISTPAELLDRVNKLLPECTKATEELYAKERLPPAENINIGINP